MLIREIDMRRTYLAGFRRLWFVLSILWMVASVAIVFDRYHAFRDFILLGVVPVIISYFLFSAVTWTIQGFSRPAA